MMYKRNVIMRVSYRYTNDVVSRTAIFTKLISVEVPLPLSASYEKNYDFINKVVNNIAKTRARRAFEVNCYSVIETSRIDTTYVTTLDCTNYNKLEHSLKITF